ncbi:MAG: hypothetical protein HZB57_10950 [Gammaproteobacteria bacterium]|nr:hypothetical protein [Gammaproteobacteria bacterium]
MLDSNKGLTMAKLIHKNLFHYGDSSEVYAALQEHYNRDTWIHSLWQIVLFGCAIGAVVFSGHTDWLWICAGLYATERAITRFVDNSNRNWAMHVIDWVEAKRAHESEESNY